MLERTEEQVLLDLLNSTPMTAGGRLDLLAGEGAAWALERGGVGSAEELARLRRVRDRLQAVVLGVSPEATLDPMLRVVRLHPEVHGTGVRWRLDAEADGLLAARALLAWSRLRERWPGRLRPCANNECGLFLLDRTRANTARWCSMRTCGNRLKARRHYHRQGQ